MRQGPGRYFQILRHRNQRETSFSFPITPGSQGIGDRVVQYDSKMSHVFVAACRTGAGTWLVTVKAKTQQLP